MEHTSLLSNSRDNDFIGINLYTDDEASFSGAGINQRASEIASCCGIQLQARQFLGVPCQPLHRIQHTSDVNAYVKGGCRHSQHYTCIQCLQVNGDAFIGRTFDNGDDFKRLEFTVSEVSSSAAWVQVRPLIAFGVTSSWTSSSAC